MRAFVLTTLFLFLSVVAFAEPVKILFGGDVTLNETYVSIAKESRKNPGFSFEGIRELIDESDFFVINLETAVTDSDRPIPKKFNFKMKKENLGILKAGRVNLVSLANNHSFDYGRRGLEDTLKALSDFGIAQIGAGNSLEEARRAHRVELKGRKISFLAYGNMNEYPEAEKFVAYRHTEHVVSDVAREKREWADFVIVFFHWGVERDLKPRQREIDLARATIRAGADAIVGSHPHVVQPIEYFEGKPVVYSLGNFIFGGNSRGPDKGLLAQIVISDEGKAEVRGIEVQIGPLTTKYQPKEIKKRIYVADQTASP